MRRSKHVLALAAAVASAALASRAGAAVKTWAHAGTDFNTAANWTGGLPGTGDNAYFPAPSATPVLTPNLSGSITISAVNFSTATSVGYTLSASSGSLFLNSTATSTTGSALSANNTTGSNFVTIPLVLNAAAASTQSATIAAGGTLEVSGNITSTNAITFAKRGSGTLVLSGTNSYTGDTTVLAGVLSLGNLGDQGSTTSNLGTGTLHLGTGSVAGTLLYTGGSASSTRIIDMAGTTGGAIIQSDNGALTLSSDITTSVAGAKTLTLAGGAGGGGTISGKISDSSSGITSLMKSGASTWTLSKANTHTGTTTVSQGTLISGVNDVFNGGALSISAGATLSMGTTSNTVGAVTVADTGAITGNGTLTGTSFSLATGTLDVHLAGSGGITKAVAGDLTLTAANTYAGTTALNAGRLIAADANALGNPTGSLVNLKSVATLSLAADSTAAYNIATVDNTLTHTIEVDKATAGDGSSLSYALGTLKLANGSTIDVTKGSKVTSGVPKLSFSSISQTGNSSSGYTIKATGADVTLGTFSVDGTGTGSRRFQMDGIRTGNEVTGAITNAGTGTLKVYKLGSGTWTLKSTNAYNDTEISGGTLNSGANQALGAGILTVTGASTVLSLGTTNHAVSQINLSAGGTISGTGTLTISGSLLLSDGSASANLTGAALLNKTGGNAVVLAGQNSYIGTTTVTLGKLLVNGTHTSAGAYSVAAGGTLGGTGSISTAGNAGVSVATGGMLAPGASAGNLQMSLGTGSLDISLAVTGTTGAMVFELDAIGASDKITLNTGTLSIGSGELAFDDFNFTNLGGLQAGDYTLIDTNSPINGTLASSGLSGAIGGATGTLSLGDGGQDIVLTVAVPEPTGIGLLGVGAFGLVRRRRR